MGSYWRVRGEWIVVSERGELKGVFGWFRVMGGMRVIVVLWWFLRSVKVKFRVVDEIRADFGGRLVSVFFCGREGWGLDD